jgi:hypothetical protein
VGYCGVVEKRVSQFLVRQFPYEIPKRNGPVLFSFFEGGSGVSEVDTVHFFLGRRSKRRRSSMGMTAANMGMTAAKSFPRRETIVRSLPDAFPDPGDASGTASKGAGEWAGKLLNRIC